MMWPFSKTKKPAPITGEDAARVYLACHKQLAEPRLAKLEARLKVLETEAELVDECFDELQAHLEALENQNEAVKNLQGASMQTQNYVIDDSPKTTLTEPKSREDAARRIIAQLEAEGKPIMGSEIARQLAITPNQAAKLLESLGYEKGKRVFLPNGSQVQSWKQKAAQPAKPDSQAASNIQKEAQGGAIV